MPWPGNLGPSGTGGPDFLGKYAIGFASAFTNENQVQN